MAIRRMPRFLFIEEINARLNRKSLLMACYVTALDILGMGLLYFFKPNSYYFKLGDVWGSFENNYIWALFVKLWVFLHLPAISLYFFFAPPTDRLRLFSEMMFVALCLLQIFLLSYCAMGLYGWCAAKIGKRKPGAILNK